ncbi:MAG: PAS domain S-box protein [Cyanobacteria bacterium REEB67]|nr:PAS domain S-box protein [Cyanobacteria bacterium REEB67]
MTLDKSDQDTYLDFFENAPQALFLADASGRILHANQASLELLGFADTDLIGQPCAIFFLEKDAISGLFSALRENQTIRARQVKLVTKGGEALTALIDCNACFNGDNFRYARFLVQDISGSVLNDRSSQMAQEVLKVLVDASSTDDALEMLVPVIAAGLQCDLGLVWRADEKANRLERRVLWREDTQSDVEHLLSKSNNISLILSSGFPADTWFSDRAHNIIVDGSQRCCGSPMTECLPGYKQIISFPISIGRLNWGLFGFLTRSLREVDAALLALLEKLGGQIGRFVERQQALENYQKLQESYSLALAGANDGIWDWDLTTNAVYFSPRWKSLLDYQDHELENHFDTFRSLTHPDDYPLVMDAVHRHMLSRDPYAMECRMRAKAGEYRWISTRGHCTFNAQGQPVRMSGSHRDITDLKEAELARQRSELRLLESESKFKQLAENIREVFWIVTADWSQFSYVSPAFEEFWGASCSSLYKEASTFFDTMVADDSLRVKKVLSEAIDPNGVELEFRMIKWQDPSQDLRWLRARVFPISDENGQVRHLCGIAHDITDKKEVEKHASQFYSTISHELRTPLTSIRAALGLIEGGLTGEISRETFEYTSIARDNCDRLIRLINDMLDIKKIEANHLELNVGRLQPPALILATLDSLKPYAEQSGVELAVVESGDVPDCLGDSDRVIQILTNLISNAIKFTPPGRKVLVGAARNKANVRFSVKDEGPGIAEVDKADLFGPFQQLSCIENDINRGTGLGLAISKILVERLNGTIGVNSRLGEGADFWFDLPEADALIVEGNKYTAGLSRNAGARGDALILVLEDSDSIALILKALLVKNGYSVMRAATIAGAREMLLTIEPDVILADVNLPDGNGVDFIQALRQTRNAAHGTLTPVIMLSGSEPEQKKLDDCQSIDWIRKPFDSFELVALIGKRVEASMKAKLVARQETSQ